MEEEKFHLKKWYLSHAYLGMLFQHLVIGIEVQWIPDQVGLYSKAISEKDKIAS